MAETESGKAESSRSSRSHVLKAKTDPQGMSQITLRSEDRGSSVNITKGRGKSKLEQEVFFCKRLPTLLQTCSTAINKERRISKNTLSHDEAFLFAVVATYHLKRWVGGFMSLCRTPENVRLGIGYGRAETIGCAGHF